MPRRYAKNRKRPRTTHKTYRRSRAGATARAIDPITTGAQVGGLAGLLFLIYGLLGDKLPGSASGILSAGFAITLGIALLAVAICIYFSQEAGWLGRQQRVVRTRRPATYRRRR